MRREELKEVVCEALKETLLSYGFSVDRPNEMQKDFAYLRDLRMTDRALKEVVKKSIVRVSITAFFPTLIYSVWVALKNKFHGGGQ